MKIGIFDSGIGGTAIALKIGEMFTDIEILSVNDHANVPYGSRPAHEVIALTKAAISPLLDAHCDIIIIACNTATTIALTHLREIYPHTHFIGIEPMVRPASRLTKTGVIAVCATPGTLNSKRYSDLKQLYAMNVEIIEPRCDDWATLIENNQIDAIDLEKTVKSLIKNNVDIIVLGCTHYHWIKDRIQNIAGENITILEPTSVIAYKIKNLLYYNPATAVAN